MLDVLARSQRARVCEYKRNESVLTTPSMIQSVKGSDVWMEAAGNDRTLHFMGSDIVMESGLRTTSNSGMQSEIAVKDSVAVVRLPLPDNLRFDDSVEVVAVPNAYELRKDPRRIIDNVIKLRKAAGFNRLLYLSGLGEPSTLALLTYMGVDLFDDALPRAAGISGIRLIPEAEVVTGEDESESNIKAMEEELEKIRMFIKADRLRELADQRAPSTPSSVALLRLYDDVGYEYAEETCSFIGCRFSCNTTEALRRPDIKAYKERMADYRKSENKRILLLLPCSAKKPYHISKSHKAFSSAIHTAPHDTLVQEVIVTSPLGAVPRELDAFYPANSYDIPVTGEWKPEEKEMIRSMIGDIISQGWDKVICHLGEDYELVEGLADMECTVVGDVTSPASLQNLDKALRDATKGMHPVDYLIERNSMMKNMLRFQFGAEAADTLMDEHTYAIGKFPYFKLFREDSEGKKVQLGMFTPERGGISLTLDGAQILADSGYPVIHVMNFEMKGNLFAVGVIEADPRIHVGDEAIAVCEGKVRAVGVAEMCGREMTDLKRGIAVKVRHKVK
ncbi:MAG: queuine tRNA-ribosyltransferase containing PUA domain protein [Thermoplasmata archaeon]|nr:queuine tRNA-ribosyltransferase containing PUA domain protein [Thermoplasmata archaeon]